MGLCTSKSREPRCEPASPAPAAAAPADLAALEASLEAALRAAEPVLVPLPADPCNSSVYTWGGGEFGRLGSGDEEDRTRPGPPVHADELAEVVQISAGGARWAGPRESRGAGFHGGAVTRAGEVYMWGRGMRGQLGQQAAMDYLSPVKVIGLKGTMQDLAVVRVSQLCCGWYHTLCLTETGQVWAFGLNEDGQLGVRSKEDSLLPRRVEALDGKQVVQLAAAKSTSGGVTLGGLLFVWGTGSQGQLGLGEGRVRVPPTQVPEWQGLKDGRLRGALVVQLSMGASHTGCIAYLDEDCKNLYEPFRPTNAGTQLFVWGSAADQGLWADASPWLPKRVLSASLEGRKLVQYCAGNSMSLLLSSDGAVFTWGPSGKHGQLGHGDEDRNLSPKQIAVLAGHHVVRRAQRAARLSVLAGPGCHELHRGALPGADQAGRGVCAAWPVGEWLQVWAWGRGELGQLGLDAAALEMLCSSSDEGPGFAPVPQLVDQTGIRSDEEIAQICVGGCTSGLMTSSGSHPVAGSTSSESSSIQLRAGLAYFKHRTSHLQGILTEEREALHRIVHARELEAKAERKKAKKDKRLDEKRAREREERKAKKEKVRQQKFIAEHSQYYGRHSQEMAEQLEQMYDEEQDIRQKRQAKRAAQQ